MYTGRRVRQLADGSIELSVQEYIDGLTPAKVSRPRRQQLQERLGSGEEKIFRSIMGQLMWCSRNLLLELSFPVSALAGEMAAPTVASLLQANRLLKRARALHGRSLVLRSDIDIQRAALVVWSDSFLGPCLGTSLRRDLFWLW